jgi:UDP-N-acetylmuramyl pentapeptide phosphotransferase/UDP-N-acetylglucosamine-1-phosphate transferase
MMLCFSPLAAAILAFAASVLSVGAVRRYALAHALLDRPNARSSHTLPTPRGGGVGVVFTIVLLGAVCLIRARDDWPIALSLLAILPTAVIGWLDDRRPMSITPRMVAHGASALLLLPLAMVAARSSVPALIVAAAWILVTLSAINVVNFMDGIDGLIGLQTVVLGVHYALLAAPGTGANAFGVILAGAALGFLIWNWAPARIFLGDVGSGALGVIGVIGALLVLRAGAWSVIAVFLPLFPILLDATATLVRRAKRGERLTQAHRRHLYQRLANGGWGHARTTLLYGSVAAAASVLARVTPPAAFLPAAAGYVVAVTALGAALERYAPGARWHTPVGTNTDGEAGSRLPDDG